jgi:hypothetical protein
MQWFPLAFCMIVFRHTVGLLWTSDQPVSETSTCTGQHNIETQETNVHALRGIRTRDPSNQAAADLRLRPRGYRGRHLPYNIIIIRVYEYHYRITSLSLLKSVIETDYCLHSWDTLCILLHVWINYRKLNISGRKLIPRKKLIRCCHTDKNAILSDLHIDCSLQKLFS